MLLLILSVIGTCIIQVPFQYLTVTQIIKKVVKCTLFFLGNNILKGMINPGPYIFLDYFKKFCF